MDTWLPCGRMPRKGNHLAGPGRLAGRQSSLHIPNVIKYQLGKVNFIVSALRTDCSFSSQFLEPKLGLT